LFPPFGQAIHLPHSELMCFNPEDGKCNVSWNAGNPTAFDTTYCWQPKLYIHIYIRKNSYSFIY
jgi:hypothetical protein